MHTQDKSTDYKQIKKFYNNDYGSYRVNIDPEKCLCIDGNICGYCIDLYTEYINKIKKPKKQCQIL